MREIQLGAVTILFVLAFAALVAEPVSAQPGARARVRSASAGAAHHPHPAAQVRATRAKRAAQMAGPVFNQLREPRAVLVYDSELGVHVVLGSKNHYFVDGHYYRSRFGGWEASADLVHWGPLKHAKVPYELRKQLALRPKSSKG